ncbi:hypothetical protein C0J52_28339 [Blattella germanica]|nr:hypothetical protein C0J52_28339 [Blattella germanica]
MLQPGKMLEIIKEAAKVNIDVLAIQETRWAGQGRIDKQNYSVFYSGPNTRTGQCGTGFMISAKVRKKLMSFIPLGDRMCKIRLNGRFRNITLILVYAPTEDGKEEEKHKFYNQLYNECTKIPKRDIVIILGDFNAQIGKYTLHTKTNENGKLLSKLAMANRLIIKSTCFKHKNIHKGTWKIPGGEQVNQIDHILINRRHGTSILDARSARGPNCDSDHYMVRAKLKERLAVVNNSQGPKNLKWNIEKLKESEPSQIYQDTIKRKLEELQTQSQEQEQIEQQWNTIKKVVIETATETIGVKTRKRNEEWFNDECKEVIRQKNQDRLRVLQKATRQACDKYKESRKKANKIIRKNKKAYLKTEIENIEQLSNQNDNRKLYQAVKKDE